MQVNPLPLSLMPVPPAYQTRAQFLLKKPPRRIFRLSQSRDHLHLSQPCPCQDFRQTSSYSWDSCLPEPLSVKNSSGRYISNRELSSFTRRLTGLLTPSLTCPTYSEREKPQLLRKSPTFKRM